MARLALEAHLPLLRDGEYAKRYGWQVDMDWQSGFCYVRMTCNYRSAGGDEAHVYMLRLSFDYYDAEQPGTTFVNPETREVGNAEDFQRWWPNVDGNPWINLQIQQPPEKSYLCFQWTQEFKRTHSAVPQGDPKRWDPQKHNVVGVVRMVQRALDSPHYKGYRQK